MKLGRASFWTASFPTLLSTAWMKFWGVRDRQSWGRGNIKVPSEPSKRFSKVLRVNYPAGSASPTATQDYKTPVGGGQFFADLGMIPKDSLCLSYYVRFSNDFAFVKGGKLPGLFGGTINDGRKIPDGTFNHQAQKREFRNYIGGLLGESERKNLSQMADNAIGVTYHRLHHFLTEAPWSAMEVNSRRLQVMNQCSQTRLSRGFTLIVDDSGHRKSGNFTAGIGRQYIGEIGKTDN